MKRWQRPKPCWCSGYWFPHRLTSGTCEHRADKLAVIRLLADRLQLSAEDVADLQADYCWDTPGQPAAACPF